MWFAHRNGTGSINNIANVSGTKFKLYFLYLGQSTENKISNVSSHKNTVFPRNLAVARFRGPVWSSDNSWVAFTEMDKHARTYAQLQK